MNPSKEELEDLFYEFTVALIGGSPLPDVRRSWPRQGAPAFEVDTDVVFYKIYQVMSSMTQQREDIFRYLDSPEEYSRSTYYTRTLNLVWNFYGPNSWDTAERLRDGLFQEEDRLLLSRNDIFLVPSMEPPRRVPELFQGLWYERVDLSVQFNERVIVGKRYNFIKSVPIAVVRENGDIEESIVHD